MEIEGRWIWRRYGGDIEGGGTELRRRERKPFLATLRQELWRRSRLGWTVAQQQQQQPCGCAQPGSRIIHPTWPGLRLQFACLPACLPAPSAVSRSVQNTLHGIHSFLQPAIPLAWNSACTHHHHHRRGFLQQMDPNTQDRIPDKNTQLLYMYNLIVRDSSLPPPPG